MWSASRVEYLRFLTVIRKDAIIETNGLNLKQFRVEIQDKDDEYLAMAFATNVSYKKDESHEGARKLLGFIRYSEAAGTVELTNFHAQLTLQNLSLGNSTKQQNKDLAGAHGEGFKIAAKLMADNGYRVRYEASKFYWGFRYRVNDPDNLWCYLSPIAETKVGERMARYREEKVAGISRGLTANSWEDVTVAVGMIQRQGKKIDLETFKEWIKVSLDLDQPSEVIETDHGALILDPRFQGRIYLKGLLLELNPPEVSCIGTTTKTFRFAYNLLYGKVGRERRRIEKSADEARTITRIWEAVIREGRPNIVKKYIDMLQNVSPLADVKYAKDFISEWTSNAIWKHLLEDDPERKVFFHDDKNRDRVSSCNNRGCPLTCLS
jgi:hypothetical protein